ncbi:MAG: metal-dependent hydrolase [Gemmatimonadota bacterium]|nr:metal-dependent hydrolase [Gemmatimonadota bacterium]
MYIGHIGAALAAKRVRTSIGLLVLLIATFSPDWVDSGLCLTGKYNPDGMLSHSIPAIALFALIGFAAYAIATRDRKAAIVVAAVIVSHMLLDWITGYKPTWPAGPMIGLQLYDYPVADFIAEGMVIAIGAVLYARTLPPRRRPWIEISAMLGVLLALQLAVDLAHMMLRSVPKC